MGLKELFSKKKRLYGYLSNNKFICPNIQINDDSFYDYISGNWRCYGIEDKGLNALLLKCKENNFDPLHACDSKGNTLFNLAASYLNYEVLEYLCKLGADPNTIGLGGASDYSITNAFNQIIEQRGVSAFINFKNINSESYTKQKMITDEHYEKFSRTIDILLNAGAIDLSFSLDQTDVASQLQCYNYLSNTFLKNLSFWPQGQDNNQTDSIYCFDRLFKFLSSNGYSPKLDFYVFLESNNPELFFNLYEKLPEKEAEKIKDPKVFNCIKTAYYSSYYGHTSRSNYKENDCNNGLGML